MNLLRPRSLSFTSLLFLTVGCGQTADDGGESFGTADGTSTASDTGDTGDTGAEDGGDMTPKLDVGHHGNPECTSNDGMNGELPPCEEKSPPDSFEPEVQWSWSGATHDESASTPLVANLTDDNDDGFIDVCDIPDVVVVAYDDQVQSRIFVLDGATGEEHYSVPASGKGYTPAIGDIDGDGMPEIVSGPYAYEHDGTLKWESSEVAGWGSMALADVDADGDVEIVNGRTVGDHEGNLIFTTDAEMGASSSSPVIADLDGDDDQEIIWTQVAFHHDGSIYYKNGDVQGPGLPLGFPQVADVDDDPEPEVIITTDFGVTILEHDGTTKIASQTPTGEDPGPLMWGRPIAIHDMDGDGQAELAVKSKLYYSVLDVHGDGSMSVIWKTSVDEQSGSSGGSAFDFLGDGSAEAIYADEHDFFIFDDTGTALLQVPRTSYTAQEYPIVADVDDDASAEIVVVSNDYPDEGLPTVQVIRDVEDRWIPARRIWNQHTYHVTNVREDSTIPAIEPHHWELLNTFRTQAQSEGGGVCQPKPEG